MNGLPKLMRIMGFGFRRPKQPNSGRSLAGIPEWFHGAVSPYELGF
jgi:hypothetical protein